MNIYETIVALEKQGREGVLVTVVQKEGHGPQIPGAKLLICSNGEKVGTIGGGALEHTAIKESSSIFKSRINVLKNYSLGEDSTVLPTENSNIKTGMLCGGNITLFYEYIGVKDNVIIFGAGHVGKALAYYLKPLNYNVKLYDTRPEILDEIKEYNKHLIQDYNNISNITIENGYVIIMTHSHSLDYTVLKALYASSAKPRYIGMVASKKKSEKMLKQLCSELESNLDFSQLYTPVGLKTGGSSPEEIALSIAAELQTIKYNQENHRHARNK